MRQLLHARAAHPAFHPQAAARWPEAPPSVAAVVRGAAGGEVLALQNLGADGVAVDAAAPLGRRWPAGVRDLLSGEAVTSGEIALDGHGVRWLGTG